METKFSFDDAVDDAYEEVNLVLIKYGQANRFYDVGYLRVITNSNGRGKWHLECTVLAQF